MAYCTITGSDVITWTPALQIDSGLLIRSLYNTGDLVIGRWAVVGTTPSVGELRNRAGRRVTN